MLGIEKQINVYVHRIGTNCVYIGQLLNLNKAWKSSTSQ